MIDLIRSKVPAYKGTTPTTNRRAAGLSGLWCYLFGGSASPAYRGSNDGATAPVVSRCWWSFSEAPQYKAPPTPPSPDADPCDGDPAGQEPVIGRTFHVYPAE
jgi:hypothetical protein